MGKIKSVREQVYEYVIHLIRNGELDFGDKVSILALQESLDVSRPPINEALIQLAADGYLDNIPRKGFFVKTLSRKQISDTYEIVGALDAHVVEKAMENATEKNIDMLRMLIPQMDEAIDKRNYDDYYELQEKFHRAYLELCGNSTLIDLMNDLLRRVIRMTVISKDQEAMFAHFRQANREHAAIVDHIERKNKDGLTELVENHWSGSIENTVKPDEPQN